MKMRTSRRTSEVSVANACFSRDGGGGGGLGGLGGGGFGLASIIIAIPCAGVQHQSTSFLGARRELCIERVAAHQLWSPRRPIGGSYICSGATKRVRQVKMNSRVEFYRAKAEACRIQHALRGDTPAGRRWLKLSQQWPEMAEKAKEPPQLTPAMDRELAASLPVF